MNPPLHATVYVDGEHEDMWRATLGRGDIDAWCQAHGWDAKRILRGSVVVFLYADGRAYVNADEVVLDADGRGTLDPHDENRLHTRAVLSPLRRSLPEGIGQVVR